MLTVSSRMASFYHVPVVPNENLTRKKFCHSVKVFNKIFTTDHKFDNFQRNVHKIKKYVFVTVFQASVLFTFYRVGVGKAFSESELSFFIRREMFKIKEIVSCSELTIWGK